MGMDVFGNNGNYFRANIWSWRTICYAMELAGYEVPHNWQMNVGAGLSEQDECDQLADRLEQFLKSWDENTLVKECQTLRVDDDGRFVDPGTSDSSSPYTVEREHLQAFIDFLRACGGFEIC